MQINDKVEALLRMTILTLDYTGSSITPTSIRSHRFRAIKAGGSGDAGAGSSLAYIWRET